MIGGAGTRERPRRIEGARDVVGVMGKSSLWANRSVGGGQRRSSVRIRLSVGFLFGAGAVAIRLCRKLHCAILSPDVGPWPLALSASSRTQTLAAVYHCSCPRGRQDGGLLE